MSTLVTTNRLSLHKSSKIHTFLNNITMQPDLKFSEADGKSDDVRDEKYTIRQHKVMF